VTHTLFHHYIGIYAEWREVEGSNDLVAPVTISDIESQLATYGYQNRIQAKLFFDKSTLCPIAKCWTVPYYESPEIIGPLSQPLEAYERQVLTPAL